MIREVILFLIFGLSIGSFLNVIIYRIPKNQSILGRSYCDNCKKKLQWYDLVPIISFLVLRGKCRFCKKNINWQIPLVEIITSLLFVFSILKFPILTDLSLWYFLVIQSLLISIFFIDLENGIIPDKLIIPLFLISIIYVSLNQSFINHFISFLFTFILFFLIYILTKGKGIGFGDVKLAPILGLIFGFPNIVVVLYLAFLTGGIISLILVLWGKKKLRKDTISFGPFLVLGAIFTIFLGDVTVSLLSNFL